MEPLQILPSTTSHRHEALIPSLELFARLGFADLDLNLNHLVEGRAELEPVKGALAANGQRVWIASGGYCDFFDAPPKIDETFASVERQVALARAFGVDRMRLFFGRLPVASCTPAAIALAAANIRRVADRDPDLLFMFENHDGASSRPEVCRAIVEGVDRPNVRITFDPINFEHRGVQTMPALRAILPWIAHVHLKGYLRPRQGADGHDGEFCGFGEGDVDLRDAIRALLADGYRGAFTVEYEGRGDRTLRLYESVRRAQAELAALVAPLR